MKPKPPPPDATNTVQHWREQALYQNQRKNLWKTRFHVAATCCIFLSLALIAAVCALFRPEREPMPVRPAVVESSPAGPKSQQHILASVYLNGCSGTLISKGPQLAQGISCGHCFGGCAVGHTFYVYRADGKATMGTLAAIDADHDLALFTVRADFALAVAPIPERMLTGGEITEYSVVGYPAGIGPSYYRLDFDSVPVEQRTKDDTGMWRWVFHVDGGRIQGGNSGCGLFVNECLYGVVSHRNVANDGKTLRAAPHRDLVEFVRRKGRPDCGNGFCPAPRKDAQQPEGPADPGETPAPETPAPIPPLVPEFKTNPNAPRWNPKPNVHLEMPPYDGHGKPPLDLRTPHERSAAIDKLRHEKLDARLTAIETQIATLTTKPGAPAFDPSAIQSQIEALKQQIGSAPGPGVGSLPGPVGATGAPGKPGPAGAQGAQGEQGPAGKDVDPAQQAAFDKRLSAVEAFHKNLSGSRVTVPVRTVSKPAK